MCIIRSPYTLFCQMLLYMRRVAHTKSANFLSSACFYSCADTFRTCTRVVSTLKPPIPLRSRCRTERSTSEIDVFHPKNDLFPSLCAPHTIFCHFHDSIYPTYIIVDVSKRTYICLYSLRWKIVPICKVILRCRMHVREIAVCEPYHKRDNHVYHAHSDTYTCTL